MDVFLIIVLSIGVVYPLTDSSQITNNHCNTCVTGGQPEGVSRV
jgi:hypothetical protein